MRPLHFAAFAFSLFLILVVDGTATSSTRASAAGPRSLGADGQQQPKQPTARPPITLRFRRPPDVARRRIIEEDPGPFVVNIANRLDDFCTFKYRTRYSGTKEW